MEMIRSHRASALMLLLLALIITPLLTSSAASSKNEAALREQLEQAQAALLASQKTNAQALAALKLQSTKARTAQTANAGAAQEAVGNAQDAVVDAHAANDQAVQTAVVMRGLQDQVLHTTDQSKFATYTLLITTAFSFLTLVATQLFKVYSDNRTHKWEMDATAAHRKIELEKIAEVGQQAQAAFNNVKVAGTERLADQ